MFIVTYARVPFEKIFADLFGEFLVLCGDLDDASSLEEVLSNTVLPNKQVGLRDRDVSTFVRYDDAVDDVIRTRRSDGVSLNFLVGPIFYILSVTC